MRTSLELVSRLYKVESERSGTSRMIPLTSAPASCAPLLFCLWHHSHVNENTFGFWVERFGAAGYVFDAARAARARHMLLTDKGFRANGARATMRPEPSTCTYMRACKPCISRRPGRVVVAAYDPVVARHAVADAWWYPKNLLVFSPAAEQPQVDAALDANPSSADMLAEAYLGVADGSPQLGELWRRDWGDFGRLFYEEQQRAQQRRGRRQHRRDAKYAGG